MNTKTLAVSLALAAGLIGAGAAHAQGKIYVGAVAGLVELDAPGFDKSVNAGIYGGYNMLGKDSHFAADLGGGTLAVEAQVTLTAVKGDAPVGEWDMTSTAVYAAYRHPFGQSFYAKGKLGIARYNIDLDFAAPQSGTETALSAGVGGGFKVGPGSLELEVTTHESDVYFVSAGFHMTF